jgi:hypothetical protein
MKIKVTFNDDLPCPVDQSAAITKLGTKNIGTANQPWQRAENLAESCQREMQLAL